MFGTGQLQVLPILICSVLLALAGGVCTVSYQAQVHSWIYYNNGNSSSLHCVSPPSFFVPPLELFQCNPVGSIYMALYNNLSLKVAWGGGIFSRVGILSGDFRICSIGCQDIRPTIVTNNSYSVAYATKTQYANWNKYYQLTFTSRIG